MKLRNHRERRGAAVLIAVFASLLIGAFLLFFMQDRVSFSQRMNKWDLQREQARQVAMDALVSARAAVARDAARPGTAAFEAFHGGSAAEIAVELPELTAWARELSMDVKVGARILASAPLDRLPYETGGVMRVTCELSYGAALMKRRLAGTADYEFKVTSLAPPRPFGALTLACASGEELVGEEPLKSVVRAEVALRNLVEVLEKALEEVPSGPLAGDLRGEIEAALAEVRAQADDEELARWAAHPVARGDAFSVMINGREAGGREEIEVAFLQLEKALASAAGELEETERRFDDASGAFHRAVSGVRGLVAGIDPTLKSKGEALVAAARELGRRHAEMAAEVVKVASRVIFLTGDEREKWLTDSFARLTPEFWSRRAAYRAASIEALEKLPVRDGVFALEGDQVLEGVQLAGRRILVIDGDVLVRNLTRAAGAPGENLLTLVVHGDVTLEGKVDASILVMPSEDRSRARVRVEPGTRVNGVVALGVAAELEGHGWLVRKDRWTDAGGFGTPMLTDRHQVMVAPEARQRRIEEP